MLPATLCEGVLYSDGRLFYHGLLDAQWNFVVSIFYIESIGLD